MGKIIARIQHFFVHRPWLIFSCIILLFSCNSYPPLAQELNSQLELKVEYVLLKKEDKQLSIPNSGWKILEKDKASFGFTDKKLWLRYTLKNKSEKDNVFILHLAYPPLDLIRFMLYSNSLLEQERTTGRSFPFSSREIYHKEYLFRIPLKAGEEKFAYLNIITESVLVFPYYIYPEKKLSEAIFRHEMFSSFFFGMLFIMVFYNLFLYIYIRETGLLYYVVYLIFFIIYLLIWSGMAYQYVWPNSPDVNKFSLLVFRLLVMIFAAFFASNFLRIKLYSSLFYNISYLLIFSCLCLIPVTFLLPYNVDLLLIDILTLLLAIYIISISILALRKRFYPTYYFILAWFSLIIFVSLVLFRNFGFISYSFDSLVLVQAGAAIEVLFLSFGIGYKINQDKEKDRKIIEESENRLSSLINNTRDHIYSINTSFLITAFNKGFAEDIQERLNLSIQLGDDVREYLHKPVKEQLMLNLEKAMQGNPHKDNYKIVKAQEFNEYEISYYPILEQDGKVAGVSVFNRNISDRRHARELIVMLSRFPEEDPDPVLRLSSNADILYTNQPGLEIMKEINSNDEHEIIIRTRQIVNSDKVEVFDIKIGEKCYSITLRAVKDTDYVNVYGKDITDKIQAKEELVNLNNSLEDRVKQRTLELEKEIQERRKAEELLRESEMKYRELVESANSIIIRWNYRGEIIFYNDFAEKKFGYRPEEILGRNILETIVPEEEEGGRNLRSVMFDIIENPDKYIWHINENVKKNGKKMWVAWANRAIYDKYGKVREILSIGNDISRQKYAEEQLKLSKKEAEDKAKKLSKMYSRIQSELELARKIQTKILPSVDTFHSDKLEYYYEYQPLEEVGGDFFDIDEIADGIFRVMITDATGHGIQAGLITMAIKSEYEELKWKVADPATVLEELGYRFTYKFSALNIILPCIVIDINSIQDTITYASAGYPRQILLQNGNPLWLERTEPIIGLNRNRMLVKKKESRTYKYRPGDILFLFSDGLTETRNPEKKIFGDERLLDMIHHLKENSIKDSINYIFSGIEEFRKEEPLRDDITILGIHRL